MDKPIKVVTKEELHLVDQLELLLNKLDLEDIETKYRLEELKTLPIFVTVFGKSKGSEEILKSLSFLLERWDNLRNSSLNTLESVENRNCSTDIKKIINKFNS